MADPTTERRSRRTRLLLTACLVLVALLGTAAVGAEPIASWYAQRYLREHYGWLHPRVVEMKWPFAEVQLTDVAFDKGWVQGTLDTVTVNRKTRAVWVRGGKIIADLDKRTAGSGSGEKTDIQAENLFVEAKKDKHSVLASGVTWDGKRAFFKEATASIDGALTVTPGLILVARVGTYEPKVGLQVAQLEARVPVTVKVPGLDLQVVEVRVFEVSIDEPTLTLKARSLSVTQPEPEVELLKAGEIRLTVTPDQNLDFSLGSVQIGHPWLSSKPERVENVIGLIARKPWKLTLRSPLNVSVEPEVREASVKGSCQEWSDVVAGDSILKLIPLSGQLHIGVGMKPIPHLKMDRPEYPATCAPTSCQAFKELRRSFRYTAIRADGTPFERTAGPGTLEWISLGSAGKMPLAVENLEDPGFASHRGFIRQAYENSLIENVRTGKFTRGGSTLTMQLVKNLYLGRDKTMLRKAQELLLAMAMEKCLTKSEIIELYLNVVEFGPNVYGIGPGAHHWFKKTPEALEPIEAFWMASILPRPRRTPPPGDMKGTEKLMENLAKMGKIPGFTGGTGDLDTSGWE